MRVKYLLYFSMFVLILTSCSKPWGDRSFGKNLFLLKGDVEEQAIVYTLKDDDRRTNSIYLVPPRERHLIDGKIAEHVDKFLSNDKWVIATTVELKDKKVNYWIINKDFALGDKDCAREDCGDYVKTFVTGPLTLEDFNGFRKELDIELQFSAK